MQSKITKFAFKNGARLTTASRSPLLQSRYIPFQNTQMLQFGIFSVATRRMMASLFQKENESKLIRDRLFNIRKNAESLDQGNTFNTGHSKNLEGHDFTVLDYEQPSDFILLNTPEDSALVPRSDYEDVCHEETVGKILQKRPPALVSLREEAWERAAMVNAASKRNSISTSNMIVNQQFRQFSSNPHAYASAKSLFKKKGKPMKLKNRIVNKNSVETKTSSTRPLQVARTMPKKMLADSKKEMQWVPSDHTPVLRVVRKEFI